MVHHLFVVPVVHSLTYTYTESRVLLFVCFAWRRGESHLSQMGSLCEHGSDESLSVWQPWMGFHIGVNLKLPLCTVDERGTMPLDGYIESPAVILIFTAFQESLRIVWRYD